jgi:hypothetical protein
MIVMGQILLILGLAGALAGQAMFLAIAFKHSLGWFFGCLFLPLVDIIFLCLNFKATARPFGIAVLGLLVAGLGANMAGIVWTA